MEAGVAGPVFLNREAGHLRLYAAAAESVEYPKVRVIGVGCGERITIKDNPHTLCPHRVKADTLQRIAEGLAGVGAPRGTDHFHRVVVEH